VNDFESHGGQLTIYNSFGEDSLHSHPALVAQREAEFYRHYPTFFTPWLMVTSHYFVKEFYHLLKLAKIY